MMNKVGITKYSFRKELDSHYCHPDERSEEGSRLNSQVDHTTTGGVSSLSAPAESYDLI